jgi:hypothetical protein
LGQLSCWSNYWGRNFSKSSKRLNMALHDYTKYTFFWTAKIMGNLKMFCENVHYMKKLTFYLDDISLFGKMGV